MARFGAFRNRKRAKGAPDMRSFDSEMDGQIFPSFCAKYLRAKAAPDNTANGTPAFEFRLDELVHLQRILKFVKNASKVRQTCVFFRFLNVQRNALTIRQPCTFLKLSKCTNGTPDFQSFPERPDRRIPCARHGSRRASPP